MDLVIFQNEAYIIEERIKNRFYKKYKNLIIKTSLHIENMLLIGINISIYDPILKERREKYINNKHFYIVNDYIEYIFIEITEMLSNIVNNHYYN